MKAIILAAGQGKRLLPLTKDIPKCSLVVNGKTLLERCLERVDACGIKEAVVVVGHEYDKVIAQIGPRYKNLRITYVVNSKYHETNCIYSLWLAKEHAKTIYFLRDGMVERVERKSKGKWKTHKK